MTLISLDALDGNDSPGFSESDDDFSAEEEYILLTLKHPWIRSLKKKVAMRTQR